jgi:hypothetical protein
MDSNNLTITIKVRNEENNTESICETDWHELQEIAESSQLDPMRVVFNKLYSEVNDDNDNNE